MNSARQPAAMLEAYPPALPAEHSELSATLSSTLSIKTPRAVLHKFKQDHSEPLASVLSTEEASAKLQSFAARHAPAASKGNVAASGAENVPRMLPPSQLKLSMPDTEAAMSDHAVLTPQVPFCCLAPCDNPFDASL